MKTAIMAIALMLGSFAFGQQDAAKAKKTPEERAYHLTQRMVKQLGLNEEQTAKISEINTGIAQKNEGIRNNTTMTAEQKKEIIESNHQARLSMYQGVLTTEQYNKCVAAEKAAKERREAKQADRKKQRQEQKTQPAPADENEEL